MNGLVSSHRQAGEEQGAQEAMVLARQAQTLIVSCADLPLAVSRPSVSCAQSAPVCATSRVSTRACAACSTSSRRHTGRTMRAGSTRLSWRPCRRRSRCVSLIRAALARAALAAVWPHLTCLCSKTSMEKSCPTEEFSMTRTWICSQHTHPRNAIRGVCEDSRRQDAATAHLLLLSLCMC